MAQPSGRPTDPGQLLALLWDVPGGRPRRGPERSRTLEQVVETALAAAADAGLGAVTMRAVARRLDVSAMSLYSYVPGKDALVALMIDRLYLAMPRPPWGDLPAAGRIERVADLNRRLVSAHAWLVDVSSARPPLGPGVLAKYEYELSAFSGLGLDDGTTDDCLSYLLTFVQGAARAEVAALESRRSSGTTDAEWWGQHQPFFARIFDAQRYPTAARVGTASASTRGSAYEPDHAYRFGLALTIDGICSLAPGSPTPRS